MLIVRHKFFMFKPMTQAGSPGGFRTMGRLKTFKQPWFFQNLPVQKAGPEKSAWKKFL
jgi:hypothetical protein